MNHDWQDRTRLLWGDGTVNRLQNARVLVVGAGGVGGTAIEMLGRAGIGFLGIADGDRVDITNRNRQMAALTGTVGQFKTDVLARRLREINPEIRLRLFTRYFQAETIPSLLHGYPWDCVLDAIDTILPKTALLRECVRTGIPVVSCMGSGAKQDPEQIHAADLSKTMVCPLAKIVRNHLKKEGITAGITCIFSTEPPIPGSLRYDPAGPDKRTTTGTVSYMPSLFGCHCAAAVLKKLRCGERGS